MIYGYVIHNKDILQGDISSFYVPTWLGYGGRLFDHYSYIALKAICGCG